MLSRSSRGIPRNVGVAADEELLLAPRSLTAIELVEAVDFSVKSMLEMADTPGDAVEMLNACRLLCWLVDGKFGDAFGVESRGNARVCCLRDGLRSTKVFW